MKYLFLLAVSFSLFSCEKIADALDPNSNKCLEVKKIKIIANKTSFTVGEDISFTSSYPSLSNVNYTWYRPDGSNVSGNSANTLISNCSKFMNGWHYLSANSVECSLNIRDSVFITVNNKVVNLPCTVGRDSVSFNNIPDTKLNVSKGIHPSWGLLSFDCSSTSLGRPGLLVLFHNYWKNKEPEDGIYLTSNIQTMSGSSSIYQVHVSTIYSSTFLGSQNDDTVYVSHTNDNKLKVSFCKVNLSGSLGGGTFRVIGQGSVQAP